MTAPVMSITRRTRSTPFTDRVTEAGVKSYTVYNHMLLPTLFESVEADYHHLKNHVQVWDVACERQVELHGRDAAQLVQMITPRNLARMKNDQCYYIPAIDDRGGMLNDPVAIRHAQDRWWVSLADSDLGLWLKGLAVGRGLAVDVFEPDISPLGVQGPKSDALMARVFDDSIRDLKFFRHRTYEFDGTAFTITRSGYSKQGGFEIYLEDGRHGARLWDALFEAGQDLEVRAGCPNLIERIEGGLLSYGNDMTGRNTPYEAGLGAYCHPAETPDCVGAQALLAEAQDGPKRQIRGMKIDGSPVPPCRGLWPLTAPATKNTKGGNTKGESTGGDGTEGQSAGHVSSAAWSPDLRTNVAIAMIERAHWAPGTALTVETPDGTRTGTVCALPFC